MLKRHQAMCQPVRRALRGYLDETPPLLNGLCGYAAIFERSSKIDVRRPKARVQFQACTQCMDRSRNIARLPQDNGIIEIDEMQKGMSLVERDPDLVDLCRFKPLSGGTPAFGELEQIREGKALSARELQNSGKRRNGNWSWSWSWSWS
ncbi:MAG TPA: hypothetical protein VGC14_07810 [Rhizobium sp.]